MTYSEVVDRFESKRLVETSKTIGRNRVFAALITHIIDGHNCFTINLFEHYKYVKQWNQLLFTFPFYLTLNTIGKF